jgi:hypothetical protein
MFNFLAHACHIYQTRKTCTECDVCFADTNTLFMNAFNSFLCLFVMLITLRQI